MIDTDKYEGHTPAPWDGILSGYFTIEQLKGIDKTLMQDAPLLLEEVKRLQRELDTLYEYIEWLEEFAPKAGDYNTAWDAYELAKGIHWTQMEEEE